MGDSQLRHRRGVNGSQIQHRLWGIRRVTAAATVATARSSRRCRRHRSGEGIATSKRRRRAALPAAAPARRACACAAAATSAAATATPAARSASAAPAAAAAAAAAAWAATGAAAAMRGVVARHRTAPARIEAIPRCDEGTVSVAHEVVPIAQRSNDAPAVLMLCIKVGITHGRWLGRNGGVEGRSCGEILAVSHHS
jgi:hypothetical protein